MADNPFSVSVVNPAQALLLGQQAYDASVKRAQESQRKDALAQLLGQGATPDYGKTAAALAASGDLEGAAKLATIGKALAPPETSADMQAYNLYKRQGGQGGILDFLKQKAEAGSTKISNTTNVSGEKEYDKEVGKEYGKTFLDINKAGRNASGALGNLNMMDKLIDNPDFYSGTGGATATAIKKGLVSMGIADADAAASNELFQKLSQKTVLDAAGGSLGTGFSNADRDFLQGTVANISNTPAGNRQIIQVAKAVEQRKQQVAQLARNYAASHGGRIDAGFDQALSQWADQNPLFAGASAPKATQGGNRTKSGVQWSIE